MLYNDDARRAVLCPQGRLFRITVNKRLKQRVLPDKRRRKSATLCVSVQPASGGHGPESDIMPTYKAPVDDVMFLLERRVSHRSLQQSAGLCRRHARSPRSGARRSGKILRGRAHAAQPRRRQGRLPPPRRRLGHHADGIQGSLQAAHRGRLDRRFGAGRIRRPGPADGRSRRRSTSSSARPTWPSPCIRA